MGTGNGVDLRRTDLRSNVLENPYWITSADIPAASVDTYDAVLFSFPKTKLVSPGYGTSLICIHDFVYEITTAIAGGTSVCTIGLGSLLTDGACGTLTAPGTADVTDITVDNFMQDNDITADTAGFYAPITASTAAWWAARKDATLLSFSTANTAIAITPADSVVICVVMYQTGTPTSGNSRVHMLISEVPSCQ